MYIFLSMAVLTHINKKSTFNINYNNLIFIDLCFKCVNFYIKKYD